MPGSRKITSEIAVSYPDYGTWVVLELSEFQARYLVDALSFAIDHLEKSNGHRDNPKAYAE